MEDRFQTEPETFGHSPRLEVPISELTANNETELSEQTASESPEVPSIEQQIVELPAKNGAGLSEQTACGDDYDIQSFEVEGSELQTELSGQTACGDSGSSEEHRRACRPGGIRAAGWQCCTHDR